MKKKESTTRIACFATQEENGKINKRNMKNNKNKTGREGMFLNLGKRLEKLIKKEKIRTYVVMFL